MLGVPRKRGELPGGWEELVTPCGAHALYVNVPLGESAWEDPTCRGPMPLGWEEKVTPEGHAYYINHANDTASYDDPRQPQNAPIQNEVELPDLQSDVPEWRKAYALRRDTRFEAKLRSAERGELPDGYEAREDGDEVLYFVDHVREKTTYKDPR